MRCISMTLLLLIVAVGGCGRPSAVVQKFYAMPDKVAEEFEVYADTAAKPPILHGFYRSYYEDGTRKEFGQYRDGVRVGEWVSAYADGQVRKRGRYEGGKEHGLWVSYRRDGQVRWQRSFAHGRKSGPWTYYHANGQRLRTENYTAGILDGAFLAY